MCSSNRGWLSVQVIKWFEQSVCSLDQVQIKVIMFSRITHRKPGDWGIKIPLIISELDFLVLDNWWKINQSTMMAGTKSVWSGGLLRRNTYFSQRETLHCPAKWTFFSISYLIVQSFICLHISTLDWFFSQCIYWIWVNKSTKHTFYKKNGIYLHWSSPSNY